MNLRKAAVLRGEISAALHLYRHNLSWCEILVIFIPELY